MKSMDSTEIRKAFLEFFASRGHTIVPSSSLVPEGDPTLLFTNAGMVPFKNAFLGLEKRPYSRATSAQRCLRVSGKHNDLEQVGPSPRHLTMFEMLGNFAFQGAYWKQDAIRYAWEFLTEVLEMPKERFHFTIYQEDDESYRLWQGIAGAPPEKIHRMGEKSNFWMMGNTGPCGPNTELIWDRGPEHCTCDEPNCSPALDNDCDRWWEVWNLVFMEFDQAEDGTRTPLSKPGVDTGMGFERLVAILQRVETNYDTDLFQPIMRKISELLGHDGEKHGVPYRVIADHSRALAFLLADGVLPGNEGRNYVTRMIIRRAIRFGKRLGFTKPFLSETAKVVIEIMGDYCSELVERRDFIIKAINQEEERFERIWKEAVPDLHKDIAKLKAKGETVIPGPLAFYYHDTRGLHIQIIEDIAREEDMTIDRAGFEQEMERQKKRSASVKTADRAVVTIVQLPRDFEETFLGYEPGYEYILESESDLFNLVTRSNSKLIEVNSLSKGEEGYFLFRESPFYAEGGGQVGDQGVIINLSRTGRAQVLDVERYGSGIALHKVKILQGEFHVHREHGRPRGDRCQLQIDVERRKNIMRNHTATHILHAALRKVLGYKQGIQAGSLVAPEELRFDFTHLAPLTEEEIKEVERMANEIILEDREVSISYNSLEEAKAKGAMALFTEDYQDKEKVRVVAVKDFSIELCGGTHVRRTGEIGGLKITLEEGIAAGVRRIRAVTGENLLKLIEEKEEQLWKAARLLETSEKDVLPKLRGFLEEKQRFEEKIARLKSELLLVRRDELLGGVERFDGISLVRTKTDLGGDDIKQLADMVEDKLEKGIVILGSSGAGKVMLVCKVSEELTNVFDAGKIIQEIAGVVGGGGGGNPRFAEGGGSKTEKLEEALEEGVRIVKERIKSAERRV